MRDRSERRILINDDGWIIGEEPPVNVPDLQEKVVGTYEGTPVGVLLWSVGGHETYEFETDVGVRFGEGYDHFDNPRHAHMKRNLRSLIDECGGPVTAFVNLCHDAGIEFFPSIRMNQHYEMDQSAPSYHFRRDHPELLIGRPDEDIPDGTIDSGIRTGLNFAFPEVRAHLSSIAIELVERWDVDGIELDWLRHPGYFRTEEAYGNRYLATDLVRKVRRRMDEVGDERGRRIELAVRVPATKFNAERIGLDVASWIRERLVDIVIVGGGFVPFETRVDEFVAAAEGTDCQVYGCIERLGGIEGDEMVRAIAARYFHLGASGIYLFNYFPQPVEWKRKVLNEIADPASLSRLNKRYKIDNFPIRGTRETSQIGWAFRNAIPLTQLPVALEQTVAGSAVLLQLTIADDIDLALTDNAIDSCTLLLGIDNYTPEDTLEMRLNASRIEWEFRIEKTDAEVPTFEFNISAAILRHGENEFTIRLDAGGRGGMESVLLTKVEIAIEYFSA